MCSCPRLRKLGERSFFASDARELGRSRMFARILSLFLFRVTYYNVGKFAPLMHADSYKKREKRTKSNAARLIASRTRLHILNYVVPFAPRYFIFDAGYTRKTICQHFLPIISRKLLIMSYCGNKSVFLVIFARFSQKMLKNYPSMCKHSHKIQIKSERRILRHKSYYVTDIRIHVYTEIFTAVAHADRIIKVSHNWKFIIGLLSDITKCFWRGIK